MGVLSTVSTYFKTGGPFMFVILATAVIILTLLLERLWVIGRASSLNGGKLSRDLETMVSRGDLSSAVALCRRVHTPAGKVALHIMSEASSGPARLAAAAEEGATLVLPPLGRRLAHLTLLANVATLLGLLGTIFGLTISFSAVSAADPAQRSAFLASGISQALNTTSLGLMVAVPTLIAHGYLVSLVERIADQIDEVSITLVRAFSRMESGRATPRATTRSAA